MYKRTYEIFGLQKWNEVLASVVTALPIILTGFLLCYFLWWGKWAQRRRKNKQDSRLAVEDGFGCAGLVIMAIGVFFLLPLIAWFEVVVHGIIVFVMAVLVAGTLIVLGVGWLWGRIKK